MNDTTNVTQLPVQGTTLTNYESGILLSILVAVRTYNDIGHSLDDLRALKSIQEKLTKITADRPPSPAQIPVQDPQRPTEEEAKALQAQGESFGNILREYFTKEQTTQFSVAECQVVRRLFKEFKGFGGSEQVANSILAIADKFKVDA